MYVYMQDMLVGGTDTSATAIEWALTELLHHPEAMNRAREELNSVVRPNQLVKEEDLEHLPYFNAIVKETLRLHPATLLGVPQKANQPFRLQGYDLPAGTHMFINEWAIHEDPATYDRPEEFVPERFFKGKGELMSAYYLAIPNISPIWIWEEKFCGHGHGHVGDSFDTGSSHSQWGLAVATIEHV